MKFILTTTWTATRMTIKKLLNDGYNYGKFIEKVDDIPLYIYANREWLDSQNPKKMVYHLEDEEEKGVLVK